MLRLNHITFVSDEPQWLAEFWAHVLDNYEAESRGESWAAAGPGPELFFNRMEK